MHYYAIARMCVRTDPHVFAFIIWYGHVGYAPVAAMKFGPR